MTIKTRGRSRRFRASRVVKTSSVVALVILGFVLCAVGALVARFGIDPDVREGGDNGLTRKHWRFIGGAIAIIGLALVVYELVFCDC